MESKLLKGTAVVVGAVALSTIGIFASDTLQGIDQNMGALMGARTGTCKTGSVPLSVSGDAICVDQYEVSPAEDCPYPDPKTQIETERNTMAKNCYPASVSGARPWTYVSLPQAQRLCSSAGKRLPTAEEWYRIALGTRAEECTVRESGTHNTGNERCVSDAGAYDAVGNVWEWVDETVVDGSYEGRPLPREGYVTSVDANGVAITSGENPDELYGNDYVWTVDAGVLGMIRGGFYNSAGDAGLYTVNASVPTSMATQGIGFRCVEDLI